MGHPPLGGFGTKALRTGFDKMNGALASVHNRQPSGIPSRIATQHDHAMVKTSAGAYFQHIALWH